MCARAAGERKPITERETRPWYTQLRPPKIPRRDCQTAPLLALGLLLAAENWKLLREIDVSGQHSAILGRRLNSLKATNRCYKIDETARRREGGREVGVRPFPPLSPFEISSTHSYDRHSIAASLPRGLPRAEFPKAITGPCYGL